MKPRPAFCNLSAGLHQNATARRLPYSSWTRSATNLKTTRRADWYSNTQNEPPLGAYVSSCFVLSRRHASASATTTNAKSSSRGKTPATVPSKTFQSSVPLKSNPLPKPSPPAVSPRSSSHRTAPAITRSVSSDLTNARASLNPPPFTYAPDLTVPARQADQSFFKYVWNAGRAYLSFYKAGVANVRQTSKLARSLRQKAAKEQDASEVLTRAEWQIVRRSRKDMLRLPAFGVIFLVFGEWTPLLVMYLTPLIPEPCRIPSQVNKQLRKQEDRRKDRLQRAAVNALSLMANDRPVTGSSSSTSSAFSSPEGPDAASIRQLNALQLNHYELLLASARFNCQSRMFDLLRIMPPKFWLQRSVRKQVEYLRKDDALVGRDGGFHALEKKEVERACIERGFDVLNKREDELRKALTGWYRGQ